VELQHGHPVGARRVGWSSGARGDRVVGNGPFAEAKEAIGGYLLADGRRLDEATEIAPTVVRNLRHGDRGGCVPSASTATSRDHSGRPNDGESTTA